MKKTLFHDDFSSYPTSLSPSPYYSARRIGPFEERNIDYSWYQHRGGYYPDTRVWSIDKSSGKNQLTMVDSCFAAFIVTGSSEWSDIAVEAALCWRFGTTPLGCSFGGDHDLEKNLTGILARYRSQHSHYFWGADEEGRLLLARREGEKQITLFRAETTLADEEVYTFKLTLSGSQLIGEVDGEVICEITDSESLSKGQVGFRSDRPVKISSITVTSESSGEQPYDWNDDFEANKLDLKLVRSIPGSKTWENLFFPDKSFNSRDIFFHFNVVEPEKNKIPAVECWSLSGRQLWAAGEWQNIAEKNDKDCMACCIKNTDNLLAAACGNALAVYDFNGGKVTASTSFPEGEDVGRHLISVSLINGEAAILAMNGGRAVLYDCDLKILWQVQGNLGHGPSAGFAGGDGAEYISVGYQFFDCDGKEMWQIPGLDTKVNSDMIDAHEDHSWIGKLAGDEKECLLVAASQKGMYKLSSEGEVLAQMRCGHAQHFVSGNFDSSVNGEQVMVSTLWESSGMYWLLDKDLNPIRHWEDCTFSPLDVFHCGDRDLILIPDLDRTPTLKNGNGETVWKKEIKNPLLSHACNELAYAAQDKDNNDFIALRDNKDLHFYYGD
ncbi:MAG: hypothetical protein ACYTFY_13750 [Planctomycetota bacterium]|jgi:hypothetical protein